MPVLKPVPDWDWHFLLLSQRLSITLSENWYHNKNNKNEGCQKLIPEPL